MSNKTQRKTLEKIVEEYEAVPEPHGNSTDEMIARTEYMLAKRMLSEHFEPLADAQLAVNHKTYKCPNCSWVHAAIPLASAKAQVQAVNEWHASKGEPESADIARYMRCFRCGALTTDFVPALPGDAPTGSTIQGVVVPGVFDG